jgi:predicted Rossmann-fold nucleotide-binding protein
VIVYGTSYWREIINFEALVRHGMIDRQDLKLFQYSDDPAQALALLQGALHAEPEPASPSIAHSRIRESIDR